MKIFLRLTLIFLIGSGYLKAQQFMESDIWIADVRIKEGNIFFGAAKNVTNSKGYDNQPYFMNDSILLYTHFADDLQADIFSYKLLSKSNSKFTNTTTSEYSAKLTPKGTAISVVEVEQDSSQRIWQFDLQGKNGKVSIAHLDSVGYYAWLNDTTVAAFILTEPSSLQICSTHNKQTKIIAKNIGRCLQVFSSQNLYFTMLETDSVRWLCRTEANGTFTKLIEFYKGVEDFVLTNNNIVFCAKGGLIYYSDHNYQLGWRLCGNFEALGLNNINRIALSPDNRKMAMVHVEPNAPKK